MLKTGQGIFLSRETVLNDTYCPGIFKIETKNRDLTVGIVRTAGVEHFIPVVNTGHDIGLVSETSRIDSVV